MQPRNDRSSAKVPSAASSCPAGPIQACRGEIDDQSLSVEHCGTVRYDDPTASAVRCGGRQSPLSPSARLRYHQRSRLRRPVLGRSATTDIGRLFAFLISDQQGRLEEGRCGMDVTSTGSVGGAGAVRPVQLSPVQSAESAPVSGLESPRDEVSISSAARLLEQARIDPNVRAERLAEIRTAIANGTYETPAKLEAAVERLLDEVRRSSR